LNCTPTRKCVKIIKIIEVLKSLSSIIKEEIIGKRKMIKVDFHCHTHYSSDSLQTPAQLIQAARKKGLQKVVVTDHNSIMGALEAQQIAPDLVIIGEEVKTSEGELLAIFVSERVPKGLDPMEAIQRLKAQNAFISVSHPFDITRSGWKLETLQKLAPYFDAIEIFNARCLLSKQNRLAAEFARSHNLPGTTGTDAHLSVELGRTVTVLPSFSNTDELKSAIREATYQTHLAPYWVHFGSMAAHFVKRLIPNKQISILNKG
jgi:predicted metal-dependent phosphoesterase TrpH